MPLFAGLFACLVPLLPAGGGESPSPVPPAGDAAAGVPAGLEAALERLQLPGVAINVDEWCVDVESSVCLREGLLELIACTKDTKEHESIVAVAAKPSHIHTALLLLGAKPGSPAMRRALDPEGTRFVDVPPRGGPVEVFLVLGDGGERPICEFIARAGESDDAGAPDGGGDGKFPPGAFLFAGSVLYGEGEGPRRYACDESGNVISLATFGDELLCLAGLHDDANGSLMWQVDGDKLPEVGTKVTLRLRPQGVRRVPKPGDGGTGR